MACDVLVDPVCDIDAYKATLARIANMDEAQVKRAVAAFQRELERAQEAAARARETKAEEEQRPVHAVVGMGVVGLVARDLS